MGGGARAGKTPAGHTLSTSEHLCCPALLLLLAAGPHAPDLLSAVQQTGPSVLIGLDHSDEGPKFQFNEQVGGHGRWVVLPTACIDFPLLSMNLQTKQQPAGVQRPGLYRTPPSFICFDERVT